MTAATSLGYELWELASGNQIADFDDEAAALAVVREGIAEDGADAWATVALARVEPDGERVAVAEGAALAARAQDVPAQMARAPGLRPEKLIVPALKIDRLRVDAERMARIAAGIEMYAALTNPVFSKALSDLTEMIAQAASRAYVNLEGVQAAIDALAASSGQTARLEREGHTVRIITTDETTAAVLAAATVPPGADLASSEDRITVVADGYLVVIAA